MLSNYCSNIGNKYDTKIGGINKLVPNLAHKSKYVLHYRNLQLHLSLGMKLVNVHRILKLKQSDWIKKYIEFNKDKRKNGPNSFGKYFLKMMNNSTFGKTIGNLRKIIKVRLTNNVRDYKKYVSKPSFISQKIFNKKFFAIHEIKPVLTLDKPVYVDLVFVI